MFLLCTIKSARLDSLFAWVNKMKGQACHNPHNVEINSSKLIYIIFMRNGPNGSVTKISLSKGLFT